MRAALTVNPQRIFLRRALLALQRFCCGVRTSSDAAAAGGRVISTTCAFIASYFPPRVCGRVHGENG